jgi:hypothetical protein
MTTVVVKSSRGVKAQFEDWDAANRAFGHEPVPGNLSRFFITHAGRNEILVTDCGLLDSEARITSESIQRLAGIVLTYKNTNYHFESIDVRAVAVPDLGLDCAELVVSYVFRPKGKS